MFFENSNNGEQKIGLMAMAVYITKVHAICQNGGNLAQYSYRKSQDDELVLLGEQDEYEPLCRKCYHKAVKQK
jgi:thymidine kinase